MKVNFNIKMISMPNFLRYDAMPGKKQDGFNPEKNLIPVEQLTEEQAMQYAEEMKQSFIDHWKKQTKIKKAR